uniref:tRNA pseudouridine synthase n=2 Tax=Rhizophora mucronata TaxID=61149 RepID=A0A2P2KZG9_RHIMU
MVIDVRCVPTDFHARFNARERTYFYRLLSGPEPLSTFEKERAWHVPEKLDLISMQAACKVLVGHHDFSSFRASGCQAKSPIRTLDELSVSEGVPSPYFPSVMEIEKDGLNGEEPYSCCNKVSDLPVSSICDSDREASSNGGTNPRFGIRRGHYFYIVKARARSFLYHQVCAHLLAYPTSVIQFTSLL